MLQNDQHRPGNPDSFAKFGVKSLQMESLRSRVQEIADELLDLVQLKGEMDLVKDYAYLCGL